VARSLNGMFWLKGLMVPEHRNGPVGFVLKETPPA
jgi:hypothetical protein